MTTGSGDGDNEARQLHRQRMAALLAEYGISPPAEEGREGDAAPQEVALTSQAPAESVEKERATPQGGADASRRKGPPSRKDTPDSNGSARTRPLRYGGKRSAWREFLAQRRAQRASAVTPKAPPQPVAQEEELDSNAAPLEQARLAAQAQKLQEIINNGNALPAPAPAEDIAKKAEQQAAQQAEREANAAAAQQAADEKKAADIAALTQKIANKKAEIASLEPQAPADPVAKKQLNKARHALANLENALLELTDPEAARTKKITRLEGKISAAEKELNALPAAQADKPQRVKLQTTLAALEQKIKALTPLAEQKLPTAPKVKGEQAPSATKPSRLEARVADAREKVARAEAAAAQATVAAETDPAKRAQAKRLANDEASAKQELERLQTALKKASAKAGKKPAPTDEARNAGKKPPQKPAPAERAARRLQKIAPRIVPSLSGGSFVSRVEKTGGQEGQPSLHR